jgi:hypothetical protein
MREGNRARIKGQFAGDSGLLYDYRFYTMIGILKWQIRLISGDRATVRLKG